MTQISQIRNRAREAETYDEQPGRLGLLVRQIMIRSLRNLRITLATSAARVFSAHPRPSQSPLRPVPSDPIACR